METNIDRYLRGVSIVGAVALTLLLGMCWGMTNIPPADSVRKGLIGIMRMGQEDEDSDEGLGVWVWPEKRAEWRAGVSVYDSTATHGEFTIYTHGQEEEAILIDMKGRVRHRWHLPLTRIWDETAVSGEGLEGLFLRWSNARLLENGDLYAVFEAQPIWPYGRGLVKMDRNSGVVWKNLDFIHHSFDIGDDGTIYALAQRMEEETSPNPELRLPFLNDYILTIAPDGKTRRRISLAEAIDRSHYSNLFRVGILRQDLDGDYFHSNDVEYVTESMARSHPYAVAGDLLISVRNLNALIVLDVDSEGIRHVIRGPWAWPHDPDLLDNGNILIFDNMGHVGEGGSTRVVEFDPTTQEIVWQFQGDSTFFLNTFVQGSQQRLDNGNTLITEATAARILEVTPAGEIVWEYWNPVEHPTESNRTGGIRWGERFTAEEIDFPFNEGRIAGE